jgi:leader peptidase (prepilin peptidase)/N-methyltransferase
MLIPVPAISTSQPASPEPLRSPAAAVGAPRTPWAEQPRLRAATLAAAAVLAALALAVLGLDGDGLLAAFVVAVLAILSGVDVAERRLPNRIVLPAFAVVLAAQLALHPNRALEWVLAALGAALFFYVPHLVYPAGLGMGDVKLGLLLGAALGKAILLGRLLGTASAALVGLALIAVRGAAARKTALPYGPFLAFGAVVALLLDRAA